MVEKEMKKRNGFKIMIQTIKLISEWFQGESIPELTKINEIVQNQNFQPIADKKNT